MKKNKVLLGLDIILGIVTVITAVMENNTKKKNDLINSAVSFDLMDSEAKDTEQGKQSRES